MVTNIVTLLWHQEIGGPFIIVSVSLPLADLPLVSRSLPLADLPLVRVHLTLADLPYCQR